MSSSITLARIEKVDLQRVKGWFPSPEALMQWCGPFFRYPLDDEQLESYFQTTQQEPPIRLAYKAFLPDGKVVGHIEINQIDERNRAATISKVFVIEAERGKGIAGEMVSLAVKVAFEELKLHRIALFVFDFNQPAIRCYERAGFKIEGHLRDYRKVGEQYWSSYAMSILEEDYRAKKSG